MKFTLHFGNNNFPDLAGATRFVQLAEAAGFDSVLAIDHVVFPHDYKSTYPYSATGRLFGSPSDPLPDPLIWMAFMAAATTRLRFMTGVIILPLRHPLVLAKQVATLDFMSQGRIELGIGVGWLKEEFEALGVPFEKRGKRTDEYIAAMRALWANDGASFTGEFVNFTEVSCNPKPIKGRVPIVIGGHSEAAARRAGRIGDGFFPSIGAQVDTRPLFDIARRTAETAGRDPAAIEMIAGCPELLPGASGDPQAALLERKERGIGRIVVPVGPFLPDLEETLGRFGETIIKPFGRL
ncbi:probable F420-dependent oxidoreductase, Rv2161c family [Enhydrobacter aerosaccus]|uniref:Probable F420-dependent oxidoreductase, Rv2161c family n=1 Tax=Enhydrobacter aerosaccus TaxID=225324 RepID=A0A1T4P0U0_9HYPH|nr:LLM class F420-dependent oxidoreductase [Enhydrobacter aerosaccus]SJZ85103.1 probable F420-dependent oxidoreductase, Rv2161c family [Enhydrobacter aerosaccus]